MLYIWNPDPNNYTTGPRSHSKMLAMEMRTVYYHYLPILCSQVPLKYILQRASFAKSLLQQQQ